MPYQIGPVKSALMSALLTGAVIAAVFTEPDVQAQTLPGEGLHLVVAADGSGDFTTVQAAVDSAPAGSSQRIFIDIRPGIYKQAVHVPSDKSWIALIGQDAPNTVLTYSNAAKTPGPTTTAIGTFKSATVFIDGDNFQARNITFENTFGVGSQALAIHVTGDRAVFQDCRFLGWQDTVLINSGRQYFQYCYIAGHVDYIFGAATAWFENCELHSRGKGAITAASTPKDSPYGMVFDHCRIASDTPANSVILGRPWRPFASVTFLHCQMPDAIRPTGWDNWRNPANEKTARYGEYDDSGPGAAGDGRAAWARQLTDDEAKRFTIQNVLAGKDGWNPLAEIAATSPSK